MRHLGLALALMSSACSFRVAGDNGGGAGDLSMSDVDLGGGGGAGGGGGGGGGADLATGNDLAGLPIVCTAGTSSCAGSTLVTCPDGTAQMMTTCSLGCSMMGGAHCEEMYPRAPVSRSDFDTTNLTPVNVTAGGGISTETGLIGGGPNPIRHQNMDPNAYEVHDGIGFHVVAIPGQTGKMGIYTFKSLTLAQGQSLNAYGNNALALVSAGDMTISGVVDVTCAGNVFLAGGGPNAKPYLAGPGGGAGGQPGATNSGVSVGNKGGGSGADNTHQGGGGGGAYGDAGGNGGAEGNNLGGAGGMAYGDAMLMMLVGGSGGGAGGQGGSANGSFGGGGGGVALLVAQGTLTLGNTTGAVGGVNAGGCGGTADTMVGGGGGGAGGAILLQALSVHIAAMGGAGANGGGGSAANAMASANTNGKSGAISTTAASGGAGGSAAGGAGGVASATAGTTAGQPGVDSGNSGGGGGGAVGRIRIESQSGAATVDANGIVSPAASQGTVDIH